MSGSKRHKWKEIELGTKEIIDFAAENFLGIEYPSLYTTLTYSTSSRLIFIMAKVKDVLRLVRPTLLTSKNAEIHGNSYEHLSCLDDCHSLKNECLAWSCMFSPRMNCINEYSSMVRINPIKLNVANIIFQRIRGILSSKAFRSRIKRCKIHTNKKMSIQPFILAYKHNLNVMFWYYYSDKFQIHLFLTYS
ncbi:hypothetical protein Mgra_00003690 [Meloidogyne graminicola]|uniref:Uncharacterized protein n=1 Tax=Meloidogyne graminicola TaxID=189291 RepID=A0A8S9ZUL8_9BILA|nr:hypothetical protein Mgra_00003690 [Meloidogyne graminicola]